MSDEAKTGAVEEVTRRRGRPPAKEPGQSLCTWLAQSEYDRLARLAQRERTSLGGLVRHMILVVLHSSD